MPASVPRGEAVGRASGDLGARVAALEAEVARLREELAELRQERA
jgi:uncharacterized protein YceH (UPF0502 family)